jgi:cell division transport system permease protein
MTNGADSRRALRTWRAGRSDIKLHLNSIFSLAVAFVCLAAALLVVTNIAAVRDRWSHAGRATVYIKEGTSAEDVQSLATALGGTASVKKVRIVSAAEARREVVTDEGDKTLAALPTSAFPTSLEIGFSEEAGDDDVGNIALKLRALPAVESVDTYQKWTERLSSLLGSGVTASLCLAFVVLAAVVTVIGSTMRLLLHRRRIEVEVLKLVGATDAFVRRPFVIEGATQGAAGALGAILLVGALYMLVRSRFDQELGTMLGLSPSFLPWYASVGMIALGASLGAATALISLRRMVQV